MTFPKQRGKPKPKRGKRKQQQQQELTSVGRERDWSNLPSDLVGRILSCCRSSGDRVRWASVCTRWRRSALASAKNAKISHPPWLLLPRDPTSMHPSGSQSVYSLSERKVYPIAPIPDLQQQHHPSRRGAPMRCIGSGVGWMIAVSDFTADLQLHDLVTNSITALPPLSSFRGVRKAFDKCGQLAGYTCPARKPKLKSSFFDLREVHSFYNKAVFFPRQSLVFLICNSESRLAFARTGPQQQDSCWTVCLPDLRSAPPTMEERKVSRLSDVAFHKGNFYVVSKFGYIMEIHLNSTPFPSYKPLPLEPPPDERVPEPPMYLVEVEDELMLVQGFDLFTMEDWMYFSVYKCTITSDEEKVEKSRWIEVKSLGEESVLFLGDNLSPLLLSTKDFPELTPDSIYYVRNHLRQFSSRDISKIRSLVHFPRGIITSRNLDPIQIGVFHLENGEREIEDIAKLLYASYLDDDDDDDFRNWPPPVWVPHSQCFPILSPQSAEVESSALERTRDNRRKRTKKMNNEDKLQIVWVRDTRTGKVTLRDKKSRKVIHQVGRILI